MDVNNLGVDKVINEWAPKVKDRIPSMRSKIMKDHGTPHPNLLKAIAAVDRYCLFQGYQDYFRKLVFRENVVFSHCDT